MKSILRIAAHSLFITGLMMGIGFMSGRQTLEAQQQPSVSPCELPEEPAIRECPAAIPPVAVPSRTGFRTVAPRGPGSPAVGHDWK